MLFRLLPNLLPHHADAADPELLEAIMERIDSIVPLGPVGMIIALTAIILAVPLLVLFMYSRYRSDADA